MGRSYEIKMAKSTITDILSTTPRLLPKEIEEALNFRIQQEESSSRLYKVMSNYLENAGYTNSAKLWATYAAEEATHAEWSREHLLAMGVTPELRALPQHPNSFSGLPDVIRKTLQHEMQVTKQCEDLAALCLKTNTLRTYTLAHKYLQEQVEELEKATTLLDMLNAVGTSKEGLFLLDQQIGEQL